MNTEYSIYEFIQDISASSNISESESAKNSELTYSEVLDIVRTTISENNSNELSSILSDANSGKTLKLLIVKALVQNESLSAWSDPDTVNSIFEDMAGLGLLTQYIQDPNVEEININSFDKIEVVYGDHTEFLSTGFPDPVTALDTMKKMARIQK